MGWAGLRTLDLGQSLKYDLVPLDDGRMIADQINVVGDGVNARSETIAAVGHKGRASSRRFAPDESRESPARWWGLVCLSVSKHLSIEEVSRQPHTVDDVWPRCRLPCIDKELW